MLQVDLAIPSLGHRKGLMRAIQDLRHHSAARTADHPRDAYTPESASGSPASVPQHHMLVRHPHTHINILGSCPSKRSLTTTDQLEKFKTLEDCLPTSSTMGHPPTSILQQGQALDAQAGAAPTGDVPEAVNTLVWEQQHDRLMKHLSRAQTRAALRRVYALSFKCMPLRRRAVM